MEKKRTSNFYLTNAIVDIASNENGHDPNFVPTIFGEGESNTNLLNQFICGHCWNHVKEQYGVDSPIPKIIGLNRTIVANYKVIYVRFADEFITDVDDTVFFIFAIKKNELRYFIFSIETADAYSLVEIRLFDSKIQTGLICENESMERLNQYLTDVLSG